VAQTWWLLALCGLLNLANAAVHVLVANPEGALAVRRFALAGTVFDISVLALAAAACAIAAALWSAGKDNSWLVALHGLAMAGFGLIGVSPLVKGSLSFRPVSLLFAASAVALAAFAFRAMRASLPATLGLGFAISFLAVGFGGIRLEPAVYWIWMGSWFAYCAAFMLWAGLRMHSHPPTIPMPTSIAALP
jgi:hypothetical protein